MTHKDFIKKGGCLIKIDRQALTWKKLTVKGKSELSFGSLETLESTVAKLSKSHKYWIINVYK